MRHKFRIVTTPHKYGDGYMIEWENIFGFWCFWDFANSVEEAEEKIRHVGRKKHFIKEIEVNG